MLSIDDPSYGVGGYTSGWAHEDVAIDGLTRIFAGGDRATKVLTGAANQDLTYLRRIGYE